MRASGALRQAYFASQGHDRALLERMWSRADGLSTEAMKQGAAAPERIAVERLPVRAEDERLGGNPSGRVATLREAVGRARRNFNDLKSRSTAARDPDVLDAYDRRAAGLEHPARGYRQAVSGVCRSGHAGHAVRRPGAVKSPAFLRLCVYAWLSCWGSLANYN